MLRREFWRDHPYFTRLRRAEVKFDHHNQPYAVTVELTQNEYSIEVRMAWVDYVDHQQRSGVISENLAQVAVL